MLRRTWPIVAGVPVAAMLAVLPQWLPLPPSAVWWIGGVVLSAAVVFAVVLWMRWRRSAPASVAPAPPRPQPRGKPADTDALVEDMLGQGRYALLLRPEIRANLTIEQGHRALDLLTAEMAAIGAGEVMVNRFDDEALGLPQGELQVIDDLYLDRTTVTNRRFLEFVTAGSYADRTLWRPEIWPFVGNFLDLSARPGPRHWQNGTYLPGEEDLPVTGVSWYEADAYARWVGKRLPTDAEWQKACGSPVRLAEGTLVQRRFPWGDAMDLSKANVWKAESQRPAPAAAYDHAAGPGGVVQLIGNVWEWTLEDFGLSHGLESAAALILPAPMKSIRGGAFDTYFDSQATSQFQSGEHPLSRKHNIGFRCALGVCQLRGESVPVDESESLEEVPA
ncbi:MAG: SUMF1/EgtB/PvdO family nonheme iron enzyme [Planctomycetia bacterium]|nr:SUMF1/EgtB/PvdO family nonheme iron enzyme [Planctomycetia bacterium]